MGKYAGWLDALLTILIRYKPNAHEVLGRLNDLLLINNLKLVLILEDVDRGRAMDDELIRMELPALFDRLNDCSNLKFIVAIDTGYFDPGWLHRVSGIVQNMPEIEPNKVWNELEEFRNKCFEDDYIDLTTKDEYDKKLFTIYDDGFTNASSNKFNKIYDSPAKSLSNLLSNPRSLKLIQRHVWAGWEQQLKGEVVFDELIVVNTIKYLIPPLNQYIVDKIDYLRSLNSKNKIEDSDYLEYESLTQKIEDAKAQNDIAKDIIIECINILLDYLFPGWYRLSLKGTKSVPNLDNRKGFPQSICNKPNPTNYWHRMNRGYLVDSEKKLTDQKFLSELKNTKEDSTKNLNSFASKVASDEVFAQKFYQFNKMIEESQLFEFASSIFENILKLDEEKSNDKSIGFMHTRRVFFSRHIAENEEYNNWFEKELEKALKVSFNFSNWLFYWFSNISDSKHINKDDLKNYIELAKKTWQNNDTDDAKAAEAFLNTIDVNNYSASMQLMLALPKECTEKFYDQIDPSKLLDTDEYTIFSDDLKWFAGILLKALEIDQIKILPQIMKIILNYDSFTSDKSLRKKLGIKLWKEAGYNKIIKCFADFNNFNDYQNPEVKDRMKAIKQLAILELKK